MSLPDSATPTPAIHQPLAIDVRGRRTERWLGALAVPALAIATNLLNLSILAGAVLFFSVCSLVIAGLWQQGWLGGARRLTGVRWLCDGSWVLTDAGLANLPAALSAQSRVGGRWLWLRWHIERGRSEAGSPRRRSMLLLQGDLDERDLRRLGARLRLESVCRQPPRARVLGV